jgi:hypothetical protein
MIGARDTWLIIAAMTAACSSRGSSMHAGWAHRHVLQGAGAVKGPAMVGAHHAGVAPLGVHPALAQRRASAGEGRQAGRWVGQSQLWQHTGLQRSLHTAGIAAPRLASQLLTCGGRCCRCTAPRRPRPATAPARGPSGPRRAACPRQRCLTAPQHTKSSSGSCAAPAAPARAWRGGWRRCRTHPASGPAGREY